MWLILLYEIMQRVWWNWAMPPMRTVVRC